MNLRPRHRGQMRARDDMKRKNSGCCRRVFVRVQRLSVKCVQFPSLQPKVCLTRIDISSRERPSGQSLSPERKTLSGQEPALNSHPDLSPEQDSGQIPRLNSDGQHTVVLLDSEWRTFYLDPEPSLIIQLNHSRAWTKPDSEPGLGPGLHLEPELEQESVSDGAQSESEVLLLVPDTKTEVLHSFQGKVNSKEEDFSESGETFPDVKIEVEDVVEESSDVFSVSSPDSPTDGCIGFRFGDQSIDSTNLGLVVDWTKELSLKVDWNEEQVNPSEDQPMALKLDQSEENHRGDDFKVDWSQEQGFQTDAINEAGHFDFKMDQAAGNKSEDCRDALKVDQCKEMSVKVDISEGQDGGDVLKVGWREVQGIHMDTVGENEFQEDQADAGQSKDVVQADSGGGDRVLKPDWEDFCAVCSNGGDLLCCELCPKVYHLKCHVPPLLYVPLGDWVCSLCRLDQDQDQDLGKTWDQNLAWTLSPQDQRRCEKLALLLLTHQLSEPFQLPVSPQVRHYYQIVRRPVDLSSIRRKLDACHTPRYFSPEQFVDDVLLMFQNCATFNYPDSEVADAGLKLKTYFLSKLKELFPERTFPSTNQRTTLRKSRTILTNQSAEDRKYRLKRNQRRRNRIYNGDFR